MNTSNLPETAGLHKIRVDTIENEITAKAGVRLLVKRLDLIHPFISGNKWYKLKYNLTEAGNNGHSHLLTFGGAFSNHILATAFAGKTYGFQTIGVIRGEEHHPLNPVLHQARDCGMQLLYVNRETYREQKTEQHFHRYLQSLFGAFYLIPEGGNNDAGVKGCLEILSEEDKNLADYFCTACATGTTLSGIAESLSENKKAIGIAVLNAGDYLRDQLKQFVGKTSGWSLHNEYTFGGFAKVPKPLFAFTKHFIKQTGIPIEPIYTGKLFYGILDLVSRGYFPRGSGIMVIHSGGVLPSR